MFVYLDARKLARLLNKAGQSRVIESGYRGIRNLGAFARIGSAHLLQIQLTHRLVDGKRWMPRVIFGSKQAFLFSENSQEDDAAAWPLLQPRQSASHFNYRHGTAAVVIGPVVDTGAGPIRQPAPLVVMRRQKH